MRKVMLVLIVALAITTIASGISYASEAAGVYQDEPCYIGGSTVNQDGTCPHGYWASDTQYVETSSGNIIMTCKFDPVDIPDDCEVDELYMNKDFGCFISYKNDMGESISVYTTNSQFVKTPGGQAILKCRAKMP